jgi:hypothetical protein
MTGTDSRIIVSSEREGPPHSHAAEVTSQLVRKVMDLSCG